jgi:uncharacterized membrane protein YfcA
MSDPSTTTLLLLGLAGLCAGFVDAVVGGGGLVQLPALLIGLPHAAPVNVLATNKLSSFCGTGVSSATYYRRIRPDPRVFGPMTACAFVGSAGGAVVGSHISDRAFDPIVLLVLVLVGAYVVLRPELGETTLLRYDGRRHVGTAMAAGLLIGCYDGALGPGTGSFFVITLVGLLGYSFLEASAKARIANWATNLAALCVFVPQEAVLWRVGFVMGACNLVGGYLGARTAVAKGAGFVRVFFVLVVTGFTVRIAGDLVGLW